MKKIMIWLLVMLCMIPVATAEEERPIAVLMLLSQTQLDGPQEVEVTIRVSNTSGEDMPGPLALYSPTGKIIEEFGTPTLTAGESRTWEGTWFVTEEQLKQGRVVFAIQYVMKAADGSSSRKIQPYYVSVTWEKKPSQTAEIVLKGNPTTGYSWDWQGLSGDSCIKVSCETAEVNDDRELVGAPVKYTYVLEGTQPGYVEICFTYARPWAHDPTMALYNLYYDIHVDEELNVSILNTRFDW
ncbi:MAG: protease inhibitor I42 family protein [Clostridia bacterium]|nr:protease inhibitor I42 family protein [Clostridia bacterium]MBQ7137762.1 protease inhibitor I42 family protein [Clostridia bacterium]